MARFTKREEPKESESYSDNDLSFESSCDNKKKKHISSSKRKRIKKKRRSSSKKKKDSRRKEVSTSNSDTSSSFSSDDDSSVSKRKRNIKRKKYSFSKKKKKSRQDVSDSNSEEADKRLDEQIQERHDRRKKHIKKSFEYLSKLTEVDYDLFTVSTLTGRESKCSDFFKNIADSYPNPPDVSIFSSKSLSESTVAEGIPKSSSTPSTFLVLTNTNINQTNPSSGWSQKITSSTTTSSWGAQVKRNSDHSND